MSVKIKKTISILLFFIISFIAGVCLERSQLSSKRGIIIKDTISVDNNIEKIDSLNNRIKEVEEINESLKDSLYNLRTARVTKVNEVRKLPLNESVIFLENKLRDYEEEYSRNNSLSNFFGPFDYKLSIIKLSEDTIVAIPPKGVNTINSIVVERESFKNEINLLETKIQLDSVLIDAKDLVITEKDSIILKKDMNNLYKENLYKSKLSKEKKKKRLWAGVTSGIIAVLIALSIIK